MKATLRFVYIMRSSSPIRTIFIKMEGKRQKRWKNDIKEWTNFESNDLSLKDRVEWNSVMRRNREIVLTMTQGR